MTDGRKLISWFQSKEAYLEYEKALPSDFSIEIELSRQAQVQGHCPICNTSTVFKVCSGARFAERPNLREGLICIRCRLTARQRTLVLAFIESDVQNNGSQGAVLERFSRLYKRLRKIDRHIVGSEYLGTDAASGRYRVWWAPGRVPFPRLVRHESIDAMSFESRSLKCLLHTDVLEHVPDTEAALLECRRVLANGQPVIFTVPFFTTQNETTVRGYLDGNGKLVELLPSEYHGDGIKPGGIYTYYNFGWQFFELLQRIFTVAEIGAAYNPDHGLVQADSVPSPWNMRSIVFRCYA